MTVQEIVDSAKTDVPESVQKFGEQFVAALGQGQKIALDVVGTVTDATASLNGRFIDQVDTGKVPSPAAFVEYAYELAAQMLSAQKEFTLKLIDVYTPTKR